MFSFFSRRKPDSPETIIDDSTDFGEVKDLTDVNEFKMTLDERIRWRHEMVKRSVEETFRELNIISGMYRYRTMPVDVRGHYYAVMIETTKHFAISDYTSTAKLSSIEALLKKRTFDNYAVVIDGVFWRANETVEVFDQCAKRTLVIKSDKPKKTIEELTAQFPEFREFSDTVPASSELLDNEFNAVSDEEARAFRLAIAAGEKPAPMQIGTQEYTTDIMPLGPR